MPVKSLKKKPVIKAGPDRILCGTCGKEKSARDFYKLFDDSKAVQSYMECKDCIKSECSINGTQDKKKFSAILQKMDKPYLSDLINTLWDREIDPIGKYFSNLGFPKFNGLKWIDSIGVDDKEVSSIDNNVVLVTDEIINFFGAGYSDEEYIAMQKKYNFLKNNYPGKTNMHIEALLNYVRPQVKCELATAKGQVGDAKTWATIAKDAAVAAKINPSQLSTADLQGGLTNFSRLVQAVESSKDVIKIMPRFKYMPQDAPDFIIWCFVNYVRDLKGLPSATYADIYQFYDKKKIEYIEQYGDPFGIFGDDIDIRNRDTIEKFVLDYGIKVKKEREDPEEPKDVFGGD